jgi:hypothetical protein
MRSEQGRVVVKARPTFVPAEQEALGDSISIPSDGRVSICCRHNVSMAGIGVKQHSQEYCPKVLLLLCISIYRLLPTQLDPCWLAIFRMIPSCSSLDALASCASCCCVMLSNRTPGCPCVWQG